MADEQPQTPPPKQLTLQKIYVKDLSFESPRTPAVFSASNMPQTQLNIKSSAREVGPDAQEVTLTITVETKDQDQIMFLVELTQAGLFRLQGYTPEERAVLIGSYCPNTLYPFAREAIADIVAKGGFPQLLLQPLNFDALYAQAQSQRAAEAAAVAGGAPMGEPPSGSGDRH